MKRAIALIALLIALLLVPTGRASAWWPGGAGFRVGPVGRHHAHIFSFGVPFGYGYPVYTVPPYPFVPPPVVYSQPPVYPYTVPDTSTTPPAYPTGRWEWRCDSGFCQWMWVPA
jgi:hypothetical protein